MESIGEFRAGIGREKAAWICVEFIEFHITKAADDLGASKTRTKLFLQIAKYDQRKEARCKVCSNPNIPLQIYRPRFEFVLHDAEAFLDLPSTMVDLDDVLRRVIQVCSDSIKPIIALLFSDLIFVKRIYCFLCEFAAACHGDAVYETFVIRLPGALTFLG